MSCSEDEEYPFDQSPYVEFHEVIFHEDEHQNEIVDISFDVWDREGDIGVDSNEPPFHDNYLLKDSQGSYVSPSGEFTPPYYAVPSSSAEDAIGIYFIGFDDQKELYSSNDKRPDVSTECWGYYIPGTFPFNDYDTLYILANFKNASFFMTWLDDKEEFIYDRAKCLPEINGIYSLNPKTNFSNDTDSYWLSINRLSKYSWRVRFRKRRMSDPILWEASWRVKIYAQDRKFEISNTATSNLIVP